MGAVSTDAMYGSASMAGINGSWDALNGTNSIALAQVGENVYAIAAKPVIASTNMVISYVIEDITQKISNAATDIMVS